MEIGKLNNNIKFIINNSKHSSVSIVVLFKVGSKNEPLHYYGISHYIEHLMFKGTKKRPLSKQIVNELYKYGAKINAFTDKDITAYFVTIIPQHIDKALEILSDMLFNSLFRNKDLKLEKKVVINELERSESDPIRNINEINNKILYRNTPLEHSICGTRTDISNFTRKMVIKYVNNFYKLDNMVISVVGNFDKNIVSQLNKYFGSKQFNYQIKNKNLNKNFNKNFNKNLNKINQKFPKQNGIRFNNIIRNDIKQAYICISLPTYPLNNDNLYVVDIIGTILAGNMGSRLFIKLREKLGLIYTVRYYLDKYQEISGLKINFSTFNDKDSINKCIDIVINEFNKLKKEKIGKKELKYTIDFIIGNIILSKDNTKNSAIFIGQNYLLMNKTYKYKDIIKKYKKINVDDVYIVSNEIFNNNKLNISIISNKNII